jgi:hypothetical protein
MSLVAVARERRGVELASMPEEVTRSRLALASRIYLPACSIVAIAAALVGIGVASRWGGADFAGSMQSLRVDRRRTPDARHRRGVSHRRAPAAGTTSTDLCPRLSA